MQRTQRAAVVCWRKIASFWLLSPPAPPATRSWSSAGIQSRSGGPPSPSWCHASPPSSPASAGSTTSCSTPPTSTSTRWARTPRSSAPPPPPIPPRPRPSHPTPPPPRPCPPSPRSFATRSESAAPESRREAVGRVAGGKLLRNGGREQGWKQWCDEELLDILAKHWTLYAEGQKHSLDCSLNVHRPSTFSSIPKRQGPPNYRADLIDFGWPFWPPPPPRSMRSAFLHPQQDNYTTQELLLKD